jgi:DNA polymerase III alpha subunit
MRARKLALVGVVVMFLMSPWAMAQKSEEGPKYEVAKEVTIKGSIEEIREVPNPKGQIGIYLMVKSGSEIVEVRLCPHSFLKEFEIVFKKGDQLTITGAKVKVEEKEAVLAREIENGDNKLVLRDKQGVPVWTWLTKGGSN